MSAVLIDGKLISENIKKDVSSQIALLKEQGITVGLAVIIVGNNPASRVYVNSKKKDCAQCDMVSFEYALPEETTTEQLVSLIRELNDREDVNGILCQLPLPKHIDEYAVISTISPMKDVDAFHAVNVGKLMIGNHSFLPCTPSGVIQLLKAYEIEISGKNCVVLGRSNIVGKPTALLLTENDGTVTLCHSKTKNLKEICQTADILVVAIGKAGFVTADMVKPGAAVIDVGINRNSEGKLCGDIDFENVKQVAGYLTPVPGGCGLMTRAALLQNTLLAAKLQNHLI